MITPIPCDLLHDVLYCAGVDAGSDETTTVRRPEPYRGEIVSSLHRKMARLCREH